MTGNLATFAAGAKIIHVDIDPAEIGKNRRADVPIVGDAKDVTASLATELARAVSEKGNPDRTKWLNQLKDWQERFPLRYDQTDDGPIKPQYVVERVYEATRGRGDDRGRRRPAPDVDLAVLQVQRPRQFINSGGLGTMGFAVPAALGAKMARAERDRVRDRRRRVLPDDRAGARHVRVRGHPDRGRHPQQRLPRAWSGSGRSSSTTGASRRCTSAWTYPDYVKLAEAYGGIGLRAETPDEVDAVIDKALSVKDKTVVIDFRVDRTEMVFPMVPAGGSNDDVILGPEQAQPAQRAGRRADRLRGGDAMSLHTVSVLVQDQSGRARPGRRAVRPAGLQHPHPRGGQHRGGRHVAA